MGSRRPDGEVCYVFHRSSSAHDGWLALDLLLSGRELEVVRYPYPEVSAGGPVDLFEAGKVNGSAVNENPGFAKVFGEVGVDISEGDFGLCVDERVLGRGCIPHYFFGTLCIDVHEI